MPKTYDEFMKDISADELYDRMIQYGMFAEKLPSVFDGASFLAYCKDPSRPVFSDVWHDYVRYDSMRNINIPRPLGIPTPMGHERLCKCLKDEWSNLQQYFQTTTANQKHMLSDQVTEVGVNVRLKSQKFSRKGLIDFHNKTSVRCFRTDHLASLRSRLVFGIFGFSEISVSTYSETTLRAAS